MSNLNKKVKDAIKILKMAEIDASEREDKMVRVPVYSNTPVRGGLKIN